MVCNDAMTITINSDSLIKRELASQCYVTKERDRIISLSRGIGFSEGRIECITKFRLDRVAAIITTANNSISTSDIFDNDVADCGCSAKGTSDLTCAISAIDCHILNRSTVERLGSDDTRNTTNHLRTANRKIFGLEVGVISD